MPLAWRWAARPSFWNFGSFCVFQSANSSHDKPLCWSSHYSREWHTHTQKKSHNVFLLTGFLHWKHISWAHDGHCTFFLSRFGLMKQLPHLSCTHTHTPHNEKLYSYQVKSSQYTHTHSVSNSHSHTTENLGPSAGPFPPASLLPYHKGPARAHGSRNTIQHTQLNTLYLLLYI